ncbi:MAG TPA: hypothetical protein VJT31_25110 [Rugosimonospora sp.]|nr:hypothetical protein [Rugosimonospora sp.]
MRWKTTLMSAVGLVLVVPACASNSGSGGTAAAGGSTVSTRDIPGIGMALVGTDGKTLYFAEAEANAAIRCTDACVSYWVPLTVAAGKAPDGGSGVTGKLATVNRPDGKVQVTYDGKPLYEFIQDSAPGDAKGNGVTDSFRGVQFVWHAAVPSGAAPIGATPGGTDNRGGYGGGGY